MSARNKRALLLSLVVTVVLSLLPISSHAAVDWTEGFEYANQTALEAVWDSSCPGSTYSLSSTTDRPHSGSKSLKMIYRGHQATGGNPATPGYGSCFIIRPFNSPSETLYTRWWMYMENFTIDGTSTKTTRHEQPGVYPGIWWIFPFGQNSLSAAVEGIILDNGTQSSEIVSGGSVPQNQWACIETRLTMSTPGVDNGIMQQWINGTQTLNNTTQRMRSATVQQNNGPNGKFSEIKIYVQDGVGIIYLDDYAVSRDTRIGCSGSVPTNDTTAPAPPQGLFVR